MVACAAAPAMAERAPVPQVDALLACRDLTDATARVACYDAKGEQLRAAMAAGDVLVASKQELVTKRREGFGFSAAGKGPVFETKDQPEISEVTTRLTDVQSFGYGQWRMVTADHGTWETTSGDAFDFQPAAGMTVNIRRGSLGSFVVRLPRGSALKVRRVR